MLNTIASMLGMGWSHCRSGLHLAEELLLQLVGPALVSLGVSCQVSNVCTLEHHLRTRPRQQDRLAAAHKTTQSCSHGRLHRLRVQRHACARLMQLVQGWCAVCNPSPTAHTAPVCEQSYTLTGATMLVHTAQSQLWQQADSRAAAAPVRHSE